MSTPHPPRNRGRRALKWIGIALAVLFAIGFIGNLVDPVDPEPVAQPSATQEPAATESPSTTPTAEQTTPAPAATSEEPEPAASPTALTDLQSELEGETWADQVTSVTTEGQLVVVDTTLVDPRKESSAEGMIAATVCNAAERAFGDDKTIRVQESDGTTFATNQFGQCEQY